MRLTRSPSFLSAALYRTRPSLPDRLGRLVHVHDIVRVGSVRVPFYAASIRTSTDFPSGILRSEWRIGHWERNREGVSSAQLTFWGQRAPHFLNRIARQRQARAGTGNRWTRAIWRPNRTARTPCARHEGTFLTLCRKLGFAPCSCESSQARCRFRSGPTGPADHTSPRCPAGRIASAGV